MPILPVDLQAILVRADAVTRLQQQHQEGVVAAQMLRGAELSEQTKIESSRVNMVKPHPDGNTRIEEDREHTGRKGISEYERKKRKEQKKSSGPRGEDFEEPYKGTIIDTVR